MRKEDVFHVIIHRKTSPQLYLGRDTNRLRHNWQSWPTSTRRKATSPRQPPTPFWMASRKRDWGLSTRSDHTRGRRTTAKWNWTTAKWNRPTTRKRNRTLHHWSRNHWWGGRRTRSIWDKWQRGRHHTQFWRNRPPNVRHHRRPKCVKIWQRAHRGFRNRNKRNQPYRDGQGYITVWEYTKTTTKNK